jgi:hypothetical protein
MWLPYTDWVVVVSCNELEGDAPPVTPWNGVALEPLRTLLKDVDVRIALWFGATCFHDDVVQA